LPIHTPPLGILRSFQRDYVSGLAFFAERGVILGLGLVLREVPSWACSASSCRAAWLYLFHGHGLACTGIYMYANVQCINDMNATLIITCSNNCKIKFTDFEQLCIHVSLVKSTK